MTYAALISKVRDVIEKEDAQRDFGEELEDGEEEEQYIDDVEIDVGVYESALSGDETADLDTTPLPKRQRMRSSSSEKLSVHWVLKHFGGRFLCISNVKYMAKGIIAVVNAAEGFGLRASLHQ